MFCANYGAPERFEKCTFKRIFRGFLVFLIKTKKKWHSYFLESTDRSRLSNTTADSAFESWNHELCVFDDFEGWFHRDLKSALPSGISENFRRFDENYFGSKVFRKWQDMMWIASAVQLHIYNETASANNSCGSPRWKYHTTSKFWVYIIASTCYGYKYIAHGVICLSHKLLAGIFCIF